MRKRGPPMPRGPRFLLEEGKVARAARLPLREGRVLALEDGRGAEHLVLHPRAVADVGDEPAFGHGGQALVALLELGLIHARQSTAPPFGAASVHSARR